MPHFDREPLCMSCFHKVERWFLEEGADAVTKVIKHSGSWLVFRAVVDFWMALE